MFQDKFSAIRAMQALSQEIPSPPPTSDNNENDNDGMTNEDNTEMGSKNNDTNQTETSDPLSSQPVDTATNPDDLQSQQQQPTSNTNDPLEDLGKMGWRFSNNLLIKTQNDRFGRKGSKSRFLMRVATTFDVLEDRPTRAPAPPPGFTTKAVLGPGSDFPQKRRRQSKQRQSRQSGRAGNGRRQRRKDGNNDRRDDSIDQFQRKPKRRRKNRHPDRNKGNEDKDSLMGGDGIPLALDQGLKAQR